MRVTKTHFHFPAQGGERSTPHGILIPESAINLAYNPATMEITYTVPNPPAEDGTLVEPTEHTIPLSQELIDAAFEEANAPTPPAVPESVTPRQIRLALIARGIMPEQITAMLQAIDNVTLRAQSLAEWEYAQAVRRDHPLIAQLAGALDFTAADVDALFIEAGLIK